MITHLAIKNYALIDDIKVDFDSGLTIITGETGAGKSILLGALSLLLGKRADMSSVKDPAKKCVIEGEFRVSDYDFEGFFSENDLDYDPNTIVRREILPGGKSRAFVNDTPVTLAQLQSLAIRLVDIHSQHETLVLSSEAFQLEVLDAMAGNGAILQSYKKQYRDVKSKSQQLHALEEQKATANKEQDYNTFLYNELKEANLDGIDLEELEETYETLNNTELIQESLASAIGLLSDEPMGAIETAKQARAALSKIKGFTSELDEHWERINSSIIEIEDLLESLHSSLDKVEADPGQLAEINEKLQVLYKLQQKHTTEDISDLIEIRDSLEAKIDETANLDDAIASLQDELDKSRERAVDWAKKLHEKRLEAIPHLKEKLEEILAELGLQNARFKFEIEWTEEFRELGMDKLELLFTANKGHSFGPLKKVASGGEKSRIMLAVKAVLVKYKQLPTIIFDEIDTGVSGEIANKMAVIMSNMSKSMQLISITHLPQIAAKGDRHIKVFKEDEDEVTFTRLKELNLDDRIVEIAKMIGGKNITEAALANARELLN
ncbi:DNA repair protein RecN [Aureitalea sp. L0-47]|uniref:DNA repair protein RecN n=1 Tax=Aureitalea sp. L0-47 TaxID=2816962 RepID=UPI002237E104|nr:DNA repair protein RecN [Aureitalea sp. L0-47]MCW5519644.1 DNA repair protein RecN [Aureitalea sp. L0-47]